MQSNIDDGKPFFVQVKSPTNRRASWIDICRALRTGKINAQNANAIARRLGISDGMTESYLRARIREAIDQGYLIGSCTKGYFFITAGDEFNEVIEKLAARRDGIQGRIDQLKENWRTYNTDPPDSQLSLF